MEQQLLDPYEQQLYAVFSGFDPNHKGSIDLHGLSQLCATLHLEEKGKALITYLLKDAHRSLVTFDEFKDALLLMLKDNHCTDLSSDQYIANVQQNCGLEREVLPKLTYGVKKYGRRSRPLNEKYDWLAASPEKAMNKVQRSNSQSDLQQKRPKTNYSLKRCTSFPGNANSSKARIKPRNPFDSKLEFKCGMSKSELRAIWNQLGAGKESCRSKQELSAFCEAIDLPKELEDTLVEKLEYNFDRQISFYEFWQVLLRAESAHESATAEFSHINSKSCPADDSVFMSEEEGVKYLTLGPLGSGVVPSALIVELWEKAAIEAPQRLLDDLGFVDDDIKISELTQAIDDEIKNIASSTSGKTLHAVLLQASIALYQAEIRCLRSILTQLKGERDKLRSDVADANQRAELLAQEVDDNHEKMQEDALSQIKIIEQRHVEAARDIAELFCKEKNQLLGLNLKLEEKLRFLEAEEEKLRSDLAAAQSFNSSLEVEMSKMTRCIADLEQAKNDLAQRIVSMENDNQSQSEDDRDQIKLLMDKLNLMHLENTDLRDRNDELSVEVESLSARLRSEKENQLKNPQIQTESNDATVFEEGVTLGAVKRRGESPSKQQIEMLFDGESPRLGKIRRFHAGGNAQVDDFASLESTEETSEVKQLQSKIVFLENILWQLGAKGDLTNTENILSTVQKSNILDDSDVGKSIEKSDSSGKASASLLKANKTAEEKDKQISSLIDQLKDAETNLELMKEEFYQCEEYWKNKLDEERHIFDSEMKTNTDKLNDLLNKITEYEEQLATADELDSPGKLPTIEEKDALEKQFTDLEEEFEEHRCRTESQLEKKDLEILELRNRLHSTELKKKPCNVAIQADLEICNMNCLRKTIEEKKSSLTHCVIESTNLFGTNQTDELNPSNLSAHPNKLERNYVNPAYGPNSAEIKRRSSPNALDKNGTKNYPQACIRPQRVRRFIGNSIAAPAKDCKQRGQLNVQSPEQNLGLKHQQQQHYVDSMHSMYSRIHQLEQKCRHLQATLAQQRAYSENILHENWQHHRSEVNDLQFMLKVTQEKLDQQIRITNEQINRLTKSDVLVSELYVENSYLTANVQRLLIHCDMLTQSSTNSSSV